MCFTRLRVGGVCDVDRQETGTEVTASDTEALIPLAGSMASKEGTSPGELGRELEQEGVADGAAQVGAQADTEGGVGEVQGQEDASIFKD